MLVMTLSLWAGSLQGAILLAALLVRRAGCGIPSILKDIWFCIHRPALPGLKRACHAAVFA